MTNEKLEIRNEYEKMKRGCVKVHDTPSFFIFISNFSFLISNLIVFLICHFIVFLISNLSFLISFLAGNDASHNARCGTEVRSEPQQDNSAGIASRDINAANYDL